MSNAEMVEHNAPRFWIQDEFFLRRTISFYAVHFIVHNVTLR